MSSSGDSDIRLAPDAYEAWTYLQGARNALNTAAYHLRPLDVPELKIKLAELRDLVGKALRECSDE